MKSSFKDYFFQAFLIVFSVLLALFLNEYWSGVKAEKELNNILQNVISEVKTNRQSLNEVIPYHRGLIDGIDSILLDQKYIDGVTGENGLRLGLIAKKGILQTLISDAAWQAALLNGSISRIDNEKLQVISKTYDQQELTFLPIYKIIDILNSREFLIVGKSKESLLLIKGQLSELYGREKILASYYDELIDIFKQE